MNYARYRKGIVAAVGVILALIQALLAGNLIPLEWVPYVQVVVTVAIAYGVYRVPNAGSPPAEDALEV